MNKEVVSVSTQQAPSNNNNSNFTSSPTNNSINTEKDLKSIASPIENEFTLEFKKKCSLLEAALRDKDIGNVSNQLEEYIQQAISDQLNPKEVADFFLNTVLPRFIRLVLRRLDIKDAELLNKQIFQLTITLIIQHIPKDNEPLIELLYRLLSQNPEEFYYKYGRNDIPEQIRHQYSEDNSSNSKDKDKEFIYAKLEGNDIGTSIYLISNINFFGRHNGFEILLQRISTEPKISLLILKSHLRSLVKIKDYLTVLFLEKYVPVLQTAVFSRLLAVSENELKGDDKKLVSEIENQVEQLAKLAVPLWRWEDDLSKFNLELAYKFFTSSVLERRLVGVGEMKKVIQTVLNKEKKRKIEKRSLL